MRIVLFLSIFLISFCVKGQTILADSIKTGLLKNYSWGIVPILAYDSDIGFKYGANFNFFDYGNSSEKEDYKQYLFIRLMNSTKNTSQIQMLFDTDRLFKNAKLIIESSYIVDKNLSFFGFNGTNSIYNSNFEDESNEQYINRYFYTHERKLFRLRADYQQQLGFKALRLYVGATLNNYSISSVDYNKYESPDSPNGESTQKTSLYDEYYNWGIIKPNEHSGGLINYTTFGFIFDTRNNQRVATKGIWTEAYGLISPDKFSEQAFSKLILSYRQYFDFYSIGMVFSYRLSSQSKMSGNIPFYMLPTYFESQINRDGLGGAFNLRGITRNRIAADGFLLGNFELRQQIGGFNLFNIDFDFMGSVFSDAAYVTQPYKFNDSDVPDEAKDQLFKNNDQTISATYGAGLYIIYNKNNIMSVYYGASYDKQLGNQGLYVGSSFLF